METDLSTHIITQQVVPQELIVDPEFMTIIEEDSPDEQQVRQLSMLLRSLCAFFKVRNHPLSDGDAAEIWKRDFLNETRIGREVLLRSARLALSLAPRSEGLQSLAQISTAEVMSLSESLVDASTVCDAMVAARHINFDSFIALGKIIGRTLDHSVAAGRLQHVYANYGAHELQIPLRVMIENLQSDKLISDVRRILVDLSRFVDYLHWIETDLKADRPLKQTLAAFTLLHEEAQTLQEFIEKRALRQTDVSEEIFDLLDSTGYALNMELRKVFGYELVGLSALRQASVIYVKVEQAHGLLSNCFQQSTVTLAQAFEPTIDGAQLFHTFQTRLDQSVKLCRDLWHLLKFVRRAGNERDRYPISSFKAQLQTFREGSLHYLMYKDWETYERFAEEISRASGAVELAPVLHRFDCYLETLLGQVRMRAVLANQPFELLTAEPQ